MERPAWGGWTSGPGNLHVVKTMAQCRYTEQNCMLGMCYVPCAMCHVGMCTYHVQGMTQSENVHISVLRICYDVA